jgi:hypothetical protein
VFVLLAVLVTVLVMVAVLMSVAVLGIDVVLVAVRVLVGTPVPQTPDCSHPDRTCRHTASP